MEVTNSIKYLQTLQSLIEADFSATRDLSIGLGIDLNNANVSQRSFLGLIISELQNQDILTQRTQHIIDGFIRARRVSEEGFVNSFPFLQSFQLLAIAHDFDCTVASIRRIADQVAGTQGLKETHNSLFGRYIEIKLFLDKANKIILDLTDGKTCHEAPPLSDVQVKRCLDLYTTASERIVLEWFQANMPGGNAKDMLSRYHDEMQKINNESVEFF
jgi:hypothetical protein